MASKSASSAMACFWSSRLAFPPAVWTPISTWMAYQHGKLSMSKHMHSSLPNPCSLFPSMSGQLSSAGHKAFKPSSIQPSPSLCLWKHWPGPLAPLLFITRPLHCARAVFSRPVPGPLCIWLWFLFCLFQWGSNWSSRCPVSPCPLSQIHRSHASEAALTTLLPA